MHPTSGILAIYVALNFCDMVHIAGFGYPDSRSQKQPIHYYGHDTMRSMKVSPRRLTTLPIGQLMWNLGFYVYS